MSYVTRIATVEIPVSDLKAAIAWYAEVLGLNAIGSYQPSWTEAMLRFPNDPAGVPTLYLVQTNATDRLQFYNTNHGYTQSIIDFQTPDLAAFHRHLRSRGVKTNRDTAGVKQGEIGGFGFFDPDGNSLGATNVVFEGRNGNAPSGALATSS